MATHDTYHSLTVTVSHEQFADLQREAKQRVLSVQGLVRELVLRHLAHEDETSPPLIVLVGVTPPTFPRSDGSEENN